MPATFWENLLNLADSGEKTMGHIADELARRKVTMRTNHEQFEACGNPFATPYEENAEPVKRAIPDVFSGYFTLEDSQRMLNSAMRRKRNCVENAKTITNLLNLANRENDEIYAYAKTPVKPAHVIPAGGDVARQAWQQGNIYIQPTKRVKDRGPLQAFCDKKGNLLQFRKASFQLIAYICHARYSEIVAEFGSVQAFLDQKL